VRPLALTFTPRGHQPKQVPFPSSFRQPSSPPHSRASTTRCLSVCEPDPLYRLAQSWRAFSPSCAGPRQANNRPLVAFVCSIKVRLEGNSDVAVGTAPIASGSAQPHGVHRFSAHQLLGKPQGGGHCLLADFRLAASQQKPPPRFAAGRWVKPTGLPSSSYTRRNLQGSADKVVTPPPSGWPNFRQFLSAVRRHAFPPGGSPRGGRQPPACRAASPRRSACRNG
jgi:hypothetical protein